jgi:long-subunit acyl-CoA synthetase (AMP-forming)
MKILMSCPFYEGYGQTENTGGAFITNSIDPLPGHVGGVAVIIM